MTLKELEENLKAVTDRVDGLIDIVRQKGFVPAFRCSHSGLLLPGDYVKSWGRNGIGIGLGSSPCSEVLDTDYDTAPAGITGDIFAIEQVMHPVGPSMAQVDLVMVPPEQLNAEAAILERDDPRTKRRASIVWDKQKRNPRSRLPLFLVAFEQAKRGI